MTVDFHAHILPKCDHGSSSLETSLEQLSLACDNGVDVICATSHFYPDRENVKDFLAKRAHCYGKLSAAVEEGALAPRILLGAEVLACGGLEKIPELESLCLEGTNILLIEMPFGHWQESLFESMEALSLSKEFRPVLAHADRYDPRNVERVLDMGVPIQLNVESLASVFSKKHLKEWIDRGVVVAFGSDIHGTDVGYRKWKKARERLKDSWDSVMRNTADMINIK